MNKKRSLITMLSVFILLISTLVVIFLITQNSDLSPDDSSASSDMGIDPRFGMGVATGSGDSTNDYGYSVINQNTRDSISLM